MNKYIIVLALVAFLVIGCNEESSILTPSNDVAGTLEKGRIIIPRSDDGGDLKAPLLDDPTISITSKYSKTFTVNGQKGGKLSVKHSWMDKNNQKVNLSSSLTIPRNAYKGELTFDVIFDLENYAVELYPSPFTFDKPIALNMIISGMDLSGIDKDTFVFDYLDGEPENLKYDYLEVDVDNNMLEISGAQIPHFSRYGWTRNR